MPDWGNCWIGEDNTRCLYVACSLYLPQKKSLQWLLWILLQMLRIGCKCLKFTTGTSREEDFYKKPGTDIFNFLGIAGSYWDDVL